VNKVRNRNIYYHKNYPNEAVVMLIFFNVFIAFDIPIFPPSPSGASA